jgi:hypothetical protein
MTCSYFFLVSISGLLRTNRYTLRSWLNEAERRREAYFIFRPYCQSKILFTPISKFAIVKDLLEEWTEQRRKTSRFFTRTGREDQKEDLAWLSFLNNPGTSVSHRSLMNHTPGALAFHRDMLLDIPLIADLITIRNSRQRIIDERLRVANLHRLNHDYRIGEQVLFKVFAPKKLEARWHGPYEIITVHANGTLTIRLNAHAVERVNVRRLKPYRS